MGGNRTNAGCKFASCAGFTSCFFLSSSIDTEYWPLSYRSATKARVACSSASLHQPFLVAWWLSRNVFPDVKLLASTRPVSNTGRNVIAATSPVLPAKLRTLMIVTCPARVMLLSKNFTSLISSCAYNCWHRTYVLNRYCGGPNRILLYQKQPTLKINTTIRGILQVIDSKSNSVLGYISKHPILGGAGYRYQPSASDAVHVTFTAPEDAKNVTGVELATQVRLLD